jgi:hypothetical protein
MAGFNGSGVFQRTYNWTNDANAAINIRADRMDTEDTGFAGGLSNVICKDGQTTITANLPMAGFLHTNVGNASMRTQYAALGQVQDSSVLLIGAIAGTNTITGNLTPAITAYVTGQRYSFIVGVTNTGAVTININAVGAVALLKKSSAGLVACVAGDLVATQEYRVFYDGTQFQFSPTPPPAQALNPFSDAIALVKNAADNTKLALFSASSLTTGTTRTYTLPDISDTLVTLMATQTLSGKTLASGTIAVTQTAGDNSTKIATTAYVATAVAAASPNSYQATPANPTGTSSATGVMMGLAGTITPATSSVISVTICGTTSNASATGNQWRIRYGTGGAPANGAALTGTAAGPVQTFTVLSGSANTTYPFSVTANITGLTPGTAYWLDLSLASTSGTATIINVGVSAIEIH